MRAKKERESFPVVESRVMSPNTLRRKLFALFLTRGKKYGTITKHDFFDNFINLI